MNSTSCAIRTWTLDITSTNLRTWQALALVFTASVYGCFWKSLSVYVTVAHEPFVHGNLDTTFSSPRTWRYSFCAIVGSTVGTCSWYFLVGFCTNSYIFCEGELGSCGRFTSLSSGVFLRHGEVFTVDASTAWFAELMHLKF